MDRIKLSTLATRIRPLRIARVHEVGRAPSLRFIATNGRCVFQVAPDDLFDGDGNRFEDNLD